MQRNQENTFMRHIFLLMGQSNMAGRGRLEDVPAIEEPRIEMFRDGQWQPAVEPLHTDKPTLAGIGLAMSFAQDLLTTVTSEDTIGLVPTAVGGTPLSRWIPGADLYEAALGLAQLALSGGKLAGILWHQGEGDSGSAETAASYAERLTGMLTTLRGAIGDVPIVVGELGPFVVGREQSPCADVVNAQINQVADQLSACARVSSEGLTDNADQLHFDARSLRIFGKRYAQAFLSLKH